MKLLALVGMVCLAAAVPPRAAAQATPYLPVLDPRYADLDALVAAGWVRGAILTERPYSRLTMARYAVEARGHAAADANAGRGRLSEALDRLERDLAAEIAGLCGTDPGCAPLRRGAALRSLAADGTLAASRTRRIPSSYDFPTADYIDADLNPLLQRNQGRVLADGGTLGVEAVVDGSFGRRFAVQAHPRATVMHDRFTGGAADVTLIEGYARALFGNFAVDAGRQHVQLGHGRDAGPVLSDNARGLDLVRISLDRPARLPWKFGALGRVTGTALVADMGANEDTPHSKLVVFDGVVQPHPNVELTVTLLNHQGGQGSPSASWIERLEDVFLLSPKGPPISDKVIGGGIAVRVPFLRTRLYTDMMTTDTRSELAEALVSEAVWISGAHVTGLGSGGRLDVWAEARHAGVRPHTHHQFTSGLTLDRRVIGDPLGPLALSVAGGAEWRARTHHAALELDLERYSNADLYVVNGSGKFNWVRTRDLPDEYRRRLVGEWAFDPSDGRLGGAVRLGYERVLNSVFKTADRRSNVLAQLRLEYRPR